MKRCLALLLLLALAGCGASSNEQALLIVTSRDWQETLLARGEVVSANVTAMSVPGQGFQQRQVLSLIGDGSRVNKGDLIAQFEARSVSKELSTLELELLRNALQSANQRGAAMLSQINLKTEVADVEGQMRLSERYANADLQSISRNDLLDKLQDLGYLSNRRSLLDWRQSKQGERAQADASVIDAQRASLASTVDQRQASLAALELRAPHDGVLRLSSSWDGSKPQVGGTVWAGSAFANLPDLSALIARFSVPQTQAQDVKPGQRAELRVAGTGDLIQSEVLRVSASASVRNRESPVKYLEFDVALAADPLGKLKLSPGQAMTVTVYLRDRKNVLVVPNAALDLNETQARVQDEQGKWIDVELGQEGGVLSEIKSGLAEGSVIRLSPTRSGKPAAPEKA